MCRASLAASFSPSASSSAVSGEEEKDDDEGDNFRRGWDDPLPRRPDGPGGNPAWWPQFEADFRAYVARQPGESEAPLAFMLEGRR